MINYLLCRVRDLFESNETFDARFQLADIIKDPTMKVHKYITIFLTFFTRRVMISIELEV